MGEVRSGVGVGEVARFWLGGGGGGGSGLGGGGGEGWMGMEK